MMEVIKGDNLRKAILAGCLSLLVWVAAATLWSATANAVPAAPGTFELKQPGGKTFTARLFGDEWNNGVETREGFTIVRNREIGAWEYAVKGPRGGLEPSGKKVGLEDPPPGLEKHLRSEITSDPLQAPGATSDPQQAPAEAPVSEGPALSSPNTGTHKSLVILVRFPDQASMGSTPAQWNAKFFGATNSVQHYYKEVSYGKLNIGPATESHGTANDGVVGWLTMNYNHPNTAGNTGSANRVLTRDAVRAADPYVNYAAYDSNGDGFLSSRELHVTVIVAGQEGSCCSTFGKSVWGHQWSLFNLTSGDERPIVDGVVFGDAPRGGGYTQFGEWHGDHMATIGIMVHEMGHDLYLPDLYDTNVADGSSEGVGNWSVMGGGSWLNTAGTPAGSTPPHLDAWSKSYEGWLTPQRASGTLAIGQAETSATAIQLRDNPNGVDWTFNTNSGTGEYFLIENRQRVGYDAALPGCGLLVWHIDETRLSDNTANANEARRLVDVEEADGLNHLDGVGNRGDGGDPYPGSTNNTTFNDTSNPNSKLYNVTSSGVAAQNMSGSCSSTMSATITDPGAVQRPANDNFANAQGLTGTNATATGTNVGATKEVGEPNHVANAGGKSVWYQWTAQANGTTTIDTAGSNFDTLLAVYTGSAVNGLTQVPGAANDDENNANGVITSKVSFAATAGTTYRIAVDGYNNNGAGAAAGNLTLNLASTGTDATAPSVTLTAPAAGAVVSGANVALSAEATDNVGIQRVEFLVGGSVVGTDTTAPYSTTWDSNTTTDGKVSMAARAVDTSSNATTTAGRDVIVDNTYPQTTITGGPAEGSTTTSTTTTFQFSSSERDSTFRCSIDGSSYEACSPGKTYGNLTGGQHTFRVYAVGAGGEANDSDSTPATRSWTVATDGAQPVSYQEDNQNFADYGYWGYYADASFSGGYSAYSNTTNDAVTFKFSGTSIVWKTNKLSDGGKTKVYLDGVYQNTFDGYSATPQYDVTGFSRTGLASGTHTLKLVVTGTKNAASSNYYTEIDRFIVGTTSYQENHWRVSFGPWQGATSGSASGGSYRQSGSAAQAAWFYGFTGPYVELITAKGPTRGVATIKVYDAQTDALVKTVSPNLYASTVQWQAAVRIDGLDSSKKYYMKVTSADGTKVVVDTYRAFPYSGTQPSAAPGAPERGGKFEQKR